MPYSESTTLPSSNCLCVETQPRLWYTQRAAYAVYPPKSSANCSKRQRKRLIGQAEAAESIRRRICNLSPPKRRLMPAPHPPSTSFSLESPLKCTSHNRWACRSSYKHLTRHIAIDKPELVGADDVSWRNGIRRYGEKTGLASILVRAAIACTRPQ